MPNDSAGQLASPKPGEGGFPLPPQQEVQLTDEVAPILSAPTPKSPEPEPVYSPPPSPRSEAETPRTPAGQPALAPAALPPSGKSFPVVTLLLLLIAIGAIAATYFFYQQTLALNTQLEQISQTLEQQKIRENQLTPTPTLEVSETPTPTSTISATVTPTVTLAPISGKVFDQVVTVIGTIQKQYPNAQLIMITISAAENPDTSIIKYWFRQTLTDKKYLYVMREPGKDLAIVDQQVYVTPDNNIPSLNQMAENNGLGLDLPEAIKIAAAACPTNFDCATTPLSAQFIRANTTLWQISYRPIDGSKPFVVQINSVTKKILFKSL